MADLDEERDNKGKKVGGLVGRGGVHLCRCDIDNFVIFVKGGSIHIIMINSDFGINFGMYKCGNCDFVYNFRQCREYQNYTHCPAHTSTFRYCLVSLPAVST